MDYVKQRAERLREELGRDITRQSIEKKLELCGYKVMYYGSEADSKGNQMLELLKFEDGIISRQAFTFPGGDGCDFVFADTSLSEEETVLALLREWCHIRLKHPVRNRILGPDFHSEQEASCLAEAIFAENASCKHKPFSLWVIPAGAAAVFLIVLLILQLGGWRIGGGRNNAHTVPDYQSTTAAYEESQPVSHEPLDDSDTVYISKQKFHRKTCAYATDVGITREQAVANGYGRCQLCFP